MLALRYTEYEQDAHGGEKMSLLWHVPKTVLEEKHVESTTTSILLFSVVVFLALLLSMGIIPKYNESI